jgi:hypothetical protein
MFNSKNPYLRGLMISAADLTPKRQGLISAIAAVGMLSAAAMDGKPAFAAHLDGLRDVLSATAPHNSATANFQPLRPKAGLAPRGPEYNL